MNTITRSLRRQTLHAKPLADALWTKLSSDATGEGEVQYVLDGGALRSLCLEDSQNIGRSVTCIVSM